MKTELVNTYEQACAITGDDPNNLPDVSALPELLGKSIIAAVKLTRIAQATNDGWNADFSNVRQDKWTPWLRFVPAVGGFVCTGTDYTRTNTFLGARFWFPDPKTAEHFGRTFIDLINDLMKAY